VYPGSKEGHLKHHHKDVVALSKGSGVPFRLHDLRRTFATVVNRHLERSLSAYTIKRLLNHANAADVTAGYVQHSIEDLREPMQAVENFILRCAGKIESAKVLTMEQVSRNREAS
jgi:integrase